MAKASSARTKRRFMGIPPRIASLVEAAEPRPGAEPSAHANAATRVTQPRSSLGHRTLAAEPLRLLAERRAARRFRDRAERAVEPQRRAEVEGRGDVERHRVAEA